MSVNNQRKNVAYGLSDALLNVSPLPIVSKRSPTTADSAPLGQIWINTALNAAFILTSIVNNAANWADIAGAAGLFSSLTVTPGPIALTGQFTLTAGTNAVNIGADAADHALNLGSITGAALTTIRGGTSGIALSAAGNVSVVTALASVASPVATAVISKRVGQATFTGFTTASGANEIFTITNTLVTATSAVLLTVANGGANDAQMTMTQLLPSANTLTIITKNNGTQSLNGNVTIAFWVLN